MPGDARFDCSTDVGELVGGAGRGGAAGRHHSDVHRAATRRAGGGDLGARVARNHSADIAEVDCCGISETAACDGDAVTADSGAGHRGDRGHLR